MLVVKAELTGLSFLLHNDTNNKYTYERNTLYMSLKTMYGFLLNRLSKIETRGFNSIGYRLPPQPVTGKISVDWRWLYG